MDLNSIRNDTLNNTLNNARNLEEAKRREKRAKEESKRKAVIERLAKPIKGLADAIKNGVSDKDAADINEAVNGAKASAGNAAMSSVK